MVISTDEEDNFNSCCESLRKIIESDIKFALEGMGRDKKFYKAIWKNSKKQLKFLNKLEGKRKESVVLRSSFGVWRKTHSIKKRGFF